MENKKTVKNRIVSIMNEARFTKEGTNRFANYDYFRPDDIMGILNPLLLKYNLITKFNLEFKELFYRGTLEIEDCESAEKEIFIFDIEKATVKGANEAQNSGATLTYCKRYSLMNAFNIADNKADFDSNEMTEKRIKQTEKKPEPEKEDNPYQIIKNAKTITELENSAKEIFKTNPKLKTTATFIALCKTQRTALEEKKAEEITVDDVVSEDVPFPDDKLGKKFNQKTFDRIKTTTGKIEYYETLSKGEQIKYSKLFEPYYNEMEGKDNE
jgi:hypothetical protein